MFSLLDVQQVYEIFFQKSRFFIFFYNLEEVFVLLAFKGSLSLKVR